MTSKRIKEITESFLLKGTVAIKDGVQVISEYYEELGINSDEITKRIAILTHNPTVIGAVLKEALDYFQAKFHTVILTDKNNKVLKIYQNEEINYSSNGSCKEHCQECKSISDNKESSHQENQ